MNVNLTMSIKERINLFCKKIYENPLNSCKYFGFLAR